MVSFSFLFFFFFFFFFFFCLPRLASGQDYGGTSTVFGMASVVNHISEMLAYFLSYPLIRKIGHIKVTTVG